MTHHDGSYKDAGPGLRPQESEERRELSIMGIPVVLALLLVVMLAGILIVIVRAFGLF